jgi:hypothetical protein
VQWDKPSEWLFGVGDHVLISSCEAGAGVVTVGSRGVSVASGWLQRAELDPSSHAPLAAKLRSRMCKVVLPGPWPASGALLCPQQLAKKSIKHHTTVSSVASIVRRRQPRILAFLITGPTRPLEVHTG